MSERTRLLREVRRELQVTLDEFDFMNAHLVGYLSTCVTDAEWSAAVDSAAQSLAMRRHGHKPPLRFSSRGVEPFSLDEPTALHSSGEGEGV